MNGGSAQHLAPQIAEVVIITAGSLQFLAAIIWTVWLIRTYRRDLKRLREGLCMHCGYDLRESKEQCPECGMQILKIK